MSPTPSIFLHWLVLGCLFAGLGAGLRWLVAGKGCPGKFADLLWAGWAAHLVVLMAWHFFWPVRLWPLALLTLLALPGLGLLRRDFRDGRAARRMQRPAFVLAVGCGIWLANYSAGPILCFDTGLYHLSAVRWSADFALVPGLANLHDRLGVQCSTHLSAAMLEFGREVGRSHHLVLGLPFWIVAAEAIFAGWRMLRAAADRSAVASSDVLALLGLVPLMYQIADLPSHSSDLPAYLIGWAAAIRLWRLGEKRGEDELGHRWALFLVVFLCAVAVTIKPSTLFFSATAVVMALTYAVYGNRRLSGYAGKLLALGAVIGLLWAGRGIVLTGYPAYPAKVAGISVDWKVPEAQVDARKYRTMAFTRERSKPWYEVLGNNRWYDDWCRALPREFWWLMRIAACALLAVGLGARASGDRPEPGARMVLAAASCSLLGWFLTAPDPRFAGAALWVWVLGMATLALVRLNRRLGPKPETLVACAFALLMVLFVTAPGTLVRMPWRLEDKRMAVPVAETKVVHIANDVPVRVPLHPEDGQLWNAALPNAPGVHPALEARDPANLGAGFRITPGTSVQDLVFSGSASAVTLDLPAGYAAKIARQKTGDDPPAPAGPEVSPPNGAAIPGFLLLYAPTASRALLSLDVVGRHASLPLSLTATVGGSVRSPVARQSSNKYEAGVTLHRGLNVFRLAPSKHPGDGLDLRVSGVTLKWQP